MRNAVLQAGEMIPRYLAPADDLRILHSLVAHLDHKVPANKSESIRDISLGHIQDNVPMNWYVTFVRVVEGVVPPVVFLRRLPSSGNILSQSCWTMRARTRESVEHLRRNGWLWRCAASRKEAGVQRPLNRWLWGRGRRRGASPSPWPPRLFGTDHVRPPGGCWFTSSVVPVPVWCCSRRISGGWLQPGGCWGCRGELWSCRATHWLWRKLRRRRWQRWRGRCHNVGPSE